MFIINVLISLSNAAIKEVPALNKTALPKSFTHTHRHTLQPLKWTAKTDRKCVGLSLLRILFASFIWILVCVSVYICLLVCGSVWECPTVYRGPYKRMHARRPRSALLTMWCNSVVYMKRMWDFKACAGVRLCVHYVCLWNSCSI